MLNVPEKLSTDVSDSSDSTTLNKNIRKKVSIIKNSIAVIKDLRQLDARFPTKKKSQF